MPKKLHRKIAKYCRSKGKKPGSKEYDRCVYGTMAKIEKGKKRKRKKK